MRKMIAIASFLSMAVVMIPGSHAISGVRIKDIARFVGVEEMEVVGYGLVVGLNGTGDTRGVGFTAQTLSNMLKIFGINPNGSTISPRNTSAVMVTARIPSFSKVGDRIDVYVSSLGDARSLQGGILLPTPLIGADGKVYAIAQGSVSTGYIVEGVGARVQRGHPTSGRIPLGARVEVEIKGEISKEEAVRLSLRSPDFTTASRVADAISSKIGEGLARALDASTVEVKIPPSSLKDVVGFLASIESIEVEPDTKAKVVVSERTGTVVLGGGVRILPVAIAHGGLSIEVTTEFDVSQPLPFAPSGETLLIPTTRLTAEERPARFRKVGGESTVEDLIKALNAIGATPRDIISILQAIKEAGALQAELEVI